MNKRQKDFIEAGIENHIHHCPQTLLRGGYAYVEEYEKLRSKIFEDGAEYGYQYALQHPQWIDVNNELPKNNGSYWCFDKSGNQGEMIWMDGSWYGLFDGSVPSETVTHWISLNPPEN